MARAGRVPIDFRKLCLDPVERAYQGETDPPTDGVGRFTRFRRRRLGDVELVLVCNAENENEDEPDQRQVNN
jgi:hypothetical protein